MCSILQNHHAPSPCCFSHIELPADLDLKRPPRTRKPFSTIARTGAVHTLDLALPEELWRLVQDKLNGDAGQVHYYRVTMTLLEVISGDFFNQYIKTGNILMISEGRRHIENRFSLKEGILKLELDKSTYERCGLVGKPVIGYGRKHVKQQFLVEINLRLPSMVQGKKQFERISRAFSKVLIDPVKWLFVNLQARADSDEGPINIRKGELQTRLPSLCSTTAAIVPILDGEEALKQAGYQEELLEWLGLVIIDSPRIREDDEFDKYLCRYDLPQAFASAGTVCQDVIHLRWRGLITPRFIIGLFSTLKAKQGKHWFGISARSFEESAYTVLCSTERKVAVWELL